MKTTLAQLLQRLVFGGEEPSALERYTLPRFFCGMVFQGIWWAGYLLVPFVLAKSLAASGELITLAVTLDTGGMLLALYWGDLLTRGNRRSVTLWGGALGRLIFLLSFLADSAVTFMILLAVVYFFASLVYPAQSGILHANFRPRLQGRIWGLGTSIGNLAAVGTSVIVGRILDQDPGLFKAVYAGIGVCGFVYLWVLSRLWQPRAGETAVGTEASRPARAETNTSPRRWLLPPPPVPSLGPWTPGQVWRRLLQPFAEAVTTYRRDRGFLWYEANFLVYGLAFLMLYTMLPILLAGNLGLSYAQISTARIVIAQSGVALLAPLMGRFSDRYHPARLCQLAFGVMALFPLGLVIAHNAHSARPELIIYLVFIIYAVGMAGVNIGWNVGPISFAPPGLGSHYQGIHVAMVGIRGLLGPVIGFTVYRFFGLDRVFLWACVLFVLASCSAGLLGRWLARRR